MGCLFAIFAGFFPRLATVLIWLARPSLFSAAFSGVWLVPLLGIIFLPFTTLMYVLVWTPQYGVYGLDWLWIILALFFDLSHWATAGYTNRNRLPWFTQV